MARNQDPWLLPFIIKPRKNGPLVGLRMTSIFSKLVNFFKPIDPPEWFKPPSRTSIWAAKLGGAVMWFWIMYRAKVDGPYMLVLLDGWNAR